MQNPMRSAGPARTRFVSRSLGLAALLLGAACSAPAPGTTSGGQTAKEKTLLAIYMVGSDLEDDVKPRNGTPDEEEAGKTTVAGAGSSDLRELISGWQALSEAQQKSLQILVAFGGARKQGWQGVKYADMPCLISDSGDNYFGNATCYAKADAQANMADGNTLGLFLQTLKRDYGTVPRKLMHLWDHGSAYLGIGLDTRVGGDQLTLPELKQAFTTAGLRFDLLGFDACLMGNLEVARVMSPFAKYMVASEELSPAHGWQYTDLLGTLAGNPNDGFDAIGRKLVDSFLDHPDHQKLARKYKTMSLLDLSQIEPAVTQINRLLETLKTEKFSGLLQTVQTSQQFGEDPLTNSVYSIDLKDWLNRLATDNPAVKPQADASLSALAKLVLYSRHDSTKPQANGISIYSLDKAYSPKYGPDESFSPAWLDFSRSFVATGSNDQSPPEVSASDFATASLNFGAVSLTFGTASLAFGTRTLLPQPFEIHQTAPVQSCDFGGKPGLCLRVSDNLGLRSVEQVFALQADPRFLFQIGSQPLTPVSGSDGYFAPAWDGEWFLLCDGDCSSNPSIFPSAYYQARTGDGGAIYSTDAVLNGENVVFYLEVGLNNRVVAAWAVPYSVGKDGEIIHSRLQLDIVAGDTLQFYYQVFDLQEQKALWRKGQSLTFRQTPHWDFAAINAPRAHYVQAEDYQGNLAISDVYEIHQP
ncbi:MAG: clostripain-related cysteine peptidase [Candidatus Sericytochromatia bacterium]